MFWGNYPLRHCLVENDQFILFCFYHSFLPICAKPVVILRLLMAPWPRPVCWSLVGASLAEAPLRSACRSPTLHRSSGRGHVAGLATWPPSRPSPTTRARPNLPQHNALWSPTQRKAWAWVRGWPTPQCSRRQGHTRPPVRPPGRQRGQARP